MHILPRHEYHPEKLKNARLLASGDETHLAHQVIPTATRASDGINWWFFATEK
jgi:hypothetical protein